MSKLFSPIKVGGVEIKNRAWVSPMCQYSAVNGMMQDWHAVNYGAYITGGAGLVMVEATAIRPEGRITPGCTGIWNDQQAQVMAEIPRFAHKYGVKVGIQLAHAGRKASVSEPWTGLKYVEPSDGGWVTEAPSAVAFEGYPVPNELTVSEISKLKNDFAAGAERALSADFDLIEIHAAHGYLLHEFLSPISNKRTDEYGGSFENRIRLLCEIASEIRLIVPSSRALAVRISASDWIDGGWDIDQSVELCRELKARGVDLVDVSSAGISMAQEIKLGPAYQTPFAEKINQETGIATSAVGSITTGAQAEEILQRGNVEAVMIGRAMLANPHWPAKAAADLGEDLPLPNQYLRAVFN